MAIFAKAILLAVLVVGVSSAGALPTPASEAPVSPLYPVGSIVLEADRTAVFVHLFRVVDPLAATVLEYKPDGTGSIVYDDSVTALTDVSIVARDGNGIPTALKEFSYHRQNHTTNSSFVFWLGAPDLSDIAIQFRAQRAGISSEIVSLSGDQFHNIVRPALAPEVSLEVEYECLNGYCYTGGDSYGAQWRGYAPCIQVANGYHHMTWTTGCDVRTFWGGHYRSPCAPDQWTAEYAPDAFADSCGALYFDSGSRDIQAMGGYSAGGNFYSTCFSPAPNPNGGPNDPIESRVWAREYIHRGDMSPPGTISIAFHMHNRDCVGTSEVMFEEPIYFCQATLFFNSGSCDPDGETHYVQVRPALLSSASYQFLVVAGVSTASTGYVACSQDDCNAPGGTPGTRLYSQSSVGVDSSISTILLPEL